MSQKKIDPEHNRAGYNAWSKTYDLELNSTVFADDEAFPALWQNVTGQVVLEVGCGTGRHTQRLARQNNSVTAIDLSPGMLREARAKPGLQSVNFMEGNVFDVQIPQDHFDVVVAALVIEHISDLPNFFLKLFGCLRPGGKAFFSEIHPERMRAGSGARFKEAGNTEETWLQSLPHSSENLSLAITGAGLRIYEVKTVFGSKTLAAQHPEWNKYLGRPMLELWSVEKS